MKIIIENGTIVTESDVYKADILVENDKILAIGTGFDKTNARIIDAKDRYVMPGAVDVHTHIDLQAGEYHTCDDFLSGTRAAASGGTTTIVEHLSFGAAKCSLHDQVNAYKLRAVKKAVVDYGVHGVIQHVDEQVLADMESLAAEGISSFKIYLTYDFALSDADVLRVMKKAKAIGAVVAVHCENDSLIRHLRDECIKEGKRMPMAHALSRPPICESEAIHRVLQVAHLAGDAAVYIVHLSTRAGLEIIQKAKNRGQKNIYVETCPQYLLFTQDAYQREDALKYIMSPPLREEADCEALWQGLADGSIDVVATDHCPFEFATDKQRGKDDFTKCPNGAPGIEERVRVMFSEGVMKRKITLTAFVKLLCTNPARIYGLYPEKGTLLPGSDADLMILDAAGSYMYTAENLVGGCDYSLYEDIKLQGDICVVMQRGKILCLDGQVFVKAGAGHFRERRVKL